MFQNGIPSPVVQSPFHITTSEIREAMNESIVCEYRDSLLEFRIANAAFIRLAKDGDIKLGISHYSICYADEDIEGWVAHKLFEHIVQDLQNAREALDAATANLKASYKLYKDEHDAVSKKLEAKRIQEEADKIKPGQPVTLAETTE